MTRLSEHVSSRYASGHVIVIPADHRGYEHAVQLTGPIRSAAKVFAAVANALCITLRPAVVCDCGMYALDWTGRGDAPPATNGEAA